MPLSSPIINWHAWKGDLMAGLVFPVIKTITRPQSQLLVPFQQSSEKHLESINITGCYDFIQNGVASHQF